MKRLSALAMIIASGAAIALAQAPAPAAAPAPIRVSDSEAAIIDKTIRGYVESRNNVIELFDRKKGRTVNLRLDRLITTDADCVVFPHEDEIALCGECTEIQPDSKKGEETTAGDKYVIWIRVKRGNLVRSQIIDFHIKSVNGNPMYTWTQAADGAWSATLVPDPVPAPAN